MSERVACEQLDYMKHVDFVSLLPPEILVIILLYVPLRNVLSCLRVCSRWNIRITELDAYWRGALNSLGVSRAISEQCQARHSTHRDLVIKMYKTREYISGSEPEIRYLSPPYPSSLYFQCNYSKHGALVGTIYEDFSPLVTTVYRVKPTGLFKRAHSFLPPSQETLHRIVWSHLYCDYLVLASASGVWRSHNLVTGKNVLSWQGPPLYEPDIMISCCETCFLVVVGKMVSHWSPKETYWEIQLISLGRGRCIPTLKLIKLDMIYPISPLATEYGHKNVSLISHSRLCNSDGFCHLHWLLLQWADRILVYEIDHLNDISAKPLIVFTSGLDLARVQLLTSDRHQSTQFALSYDQVLLGYVFCGRMHVWNLENGELEAKIHIKQKSKVQVRVISIGHIYTVIGYESIEGQLQVISTYTGKLIFGTHGFAGLGQSLKTFGTPPPYFMFLSLVDEEWLNNVDALPHPSLPVMLYWDKIRHCVSGITFHHNVAHPYHDTTSSSNSNTHVQSFAGDDTSNISAGIKERLKSILHI